MKKINEKAKGSMDVEVYLTDGFENKKEKIGFADIVLLKQGGAKRFMMKDGNHQVLDHSTLIFTEGGVLMSVSAMEDLAKLLPEGFVLVSGSYIINFDHVRNYLDGHFYMKKGELRHVVPVDGGVRKGVEERWKLRINN